MPDLLQRLSALEVNEDAERLKYDLALHSDIWSEDAARFDRFAQLFAERGSWDDGDGLGPTVGHGAIAAKLATLQTVWDLKVGLHLVANPRFTITHDRIEATWQMICPLQRNGARRLIFACGQYRERYRVKDRACSVEENLTHPAMMLVTV